MSESDTTNESSRTRVGERTNRRRALSVSLLFHLLLIGILFLWYVPSRILPDQNSGTAEVQSETSAPSAASTAPVPPKPDAAVRDPQVPSDQIEASIDSQIEAVEKLSDERKLSELEKQLARLQAMATQQSVRQTTETIADSLGLEPGPEPANDPIEGTFDPESAQIHEVTRVRDAAGNWQYLSILVDARGQTREVPMSSVEGEAAYRTFEQLKRYPMADGIYRQLVMPMLQRMIQAGDLIDKAQRESQRLQNDLEGRDFDLKPSNPVDYQDATTQPED